MTEFTPHPLDHLPTPAAIIDLPTLRRNASLMLDRARHLGVRLRPHVKTHKTVEGALIQTQQPGRPITVSTLAEASWFAQAGFDDMTWALPVSPQRIADVVTMSKRLRRFGVITDDLAVAAQLDEAARSESITLRVQLKVNVGANRAGVDPHGDLALSLARRLHESKNLHFEGLLGHEGQSYRASGGAAQMREIAAEAAEQMNTLVRRCKAAGIEVGEVSLGSTPTAIHARDLPGVTELRPGNYLLFDMTQVELGACAVTDVAFSVLTTVIGNYPERNVLVVDAGALALSLDPGVTSPGRATGHGLVVGANGEHLPSAVRVAHLSQEHGIIFTNDQEHLRALRPGDRLRVLPNHSCLAASLFPAYFIQDGNRIIDRWVPARGWNLPSEI